MVFVIDRRSIYFLLNTDMTLEYNANPSMTCSSDLQQVLKRLIMCSWVVVQWQYTSKIAHTPYLKVHLTEPR